MKIKSSLLVLFLMLFMYCKNNTEDYSAYRSAMLVNINEIIENDYALLEIKADNIHQEIIAYENGGGLFNLANARENWIIFIEQWNKVKAYNILEVKYNLLHTFIYSKPNVTKIEQNIINYPGISEAELYQLGADQKGANLVEYLLFNESSLTATDSSFVYDVNAAARMNFLLVASKELKMQVLSLKNNWVSNYSSNFLSNNGIEVGTPLNEIFNQTIETITLSLKDLNENIADENVQTYGYFSQTDFLQIHAAIEGLQILFNANGNESFSAYLKLKTNNDDLSNSIELAFEDILQDEVFEYDSFQEISLAQKEILKTKLRNLSALLSIDASSELAILVTLSDTDGD